jgi:hypothetical protein
MRIELEQLAKFRRDFIDIFETLYDYITKFIVFQSEDEPVIITNWIVHTYLIHLFDYTPYLHIFSATKQCGKSLLLSLINDLSYKSNMVINFTESIFRFLDKEEPTLCIDEIDKLNKEKEDSVWGIINNGFSRRGGFVLRTVGNNFEPKQFKNFSAKVLSGIDRSSIPDTVQDRSIPIELVRKLNSEPVARFRHREQIQIIDEITTMLEPLTTATARSFDDENSLFDETHENALIETYEDLIQNDRALDIVEPLVVVASMGTVDWLEKTINAVARLTNRQDEEDMNIDLEILRVCNHIRMYNLGSKHIFSSDLVDSIRKQSDTELAHLNGYGIDQSYLAKRLKVFGIRSKKVRIGTETKQGYEWNDFVDPAKRFLNIEFEEQVEEETIEQVSF